MFGRCLQFLWWLWRYNVHLTQAKKKAEEEKAEKERIEREAKEKEAAAKAELAANQKANDKVCFIDHSQYLCGLYLLAVLLI